MTISAQPVAYFANFSCLRAVQWIFVAVVLAVVAAPDTAEARRARAVGAYDGIWNVVFATRAGNCSATNSAPFAVAGRRVSSAGGGKVTGGIGRGGAVSVRISVGLSVASGSGRLVGNSGQADGAGSSWATAAAVPGKPRGGRNSRVPDAVQHPSRCPAEPGPIQKAAFVMDPGSAAHHAATTARLRCIRGTPVVAKKPARQMV